MKKYIIAMTLVLLLTPIYTINAQTKNSNSSCTSLNTKKNVYQTLQKQHIPEAIEQQILFSQFQKLRNELESFRNQQIPQTVLETKSIEIETLKQSIQANQKVLESKIKNLDASISMQFFQEAKSIIILTLECTQSKVHMLTGKFSSISQDTQDDSKTILIETEIYNLNLLQNNLQASIDYLNQVSDRETLKYEQEEMNIFLNEVKSTIEYSRKVYNFVTFESHLNQLKNIIDQVQQSPLISDSKVQETITARIQKLKDSTKDLSFIGSTKEKIDFINEKKAELKSILEQIKSNIQNR